MAYSNGYTYKRVITILDADIPIVGDLNNYVSLISFTNATLKSVSNGGNVNSDSGFDIRFETTSGVKLNHELELYNATTGQVIAWVLIPTIPSTGNYSLDMYYGNASVSATEEDIASTWASFIGVYHLNEPIGASATLDRTSNANHMSVVGSQLTGEIAGKINKAVQRSGSTAELSRLITDGSTNIPAGALWYSVWYRADNSSLNANSQAVWQENSGRFRIFSTGSLAITTRTYKTTGTLDGVALTTVTQNVWYHFAIRVPNVAGNFVKTYVNGANVGTGSNVDSYIGTNTAIALFSSLTANQGMQCSLSHFRISTSDLGEDYIAMEYANTNDPTIFALGNEETLSSTGVQGVTGIGTISGISKIIL